MTDFTDTPVDPEPDDDAQGGDAPSGEHPDEPEVPPEPQPA